MLALAANKGHPLSMSPFIAKRFERQSILTAVFVFAVPTLIGLLLGFSRAGIGADLPLGLSVAFWVGVALFSWILFYIATQAVFKFLKPVKPSVLISAFTGVLLSSFPSRIFIGEYAGLFEPYLLNGRRARTLTPPELSGEFILQYLQGWSGVIIVWLALNAFFVFVIDWHGYAKSPNAVDKNNGDSSERSAAQKVLPPKLISKLPVHLGTDIEAIQSEDHYLRVYTSKGEGLILYRLQDAIKELQSHFPDGLRVHRSYWVRASKVVKTTIQGRSVQLSLPCGLEVPVSQTYREIVRQAGLLDNSEGRSIPDQSQLA